MGHASVQTTASVYVERPGLDELAASVRGLCYGETSAELRERFAAQMHASPPRLSMGSASSTRAFATGYTSRLSVETRRLANALDGGGKDVV